MLWHDQESLQKMFVGMRVVSNIDEADARRASFARGKIRTCTFRRVSYVQVQ